MKKAVFISSICLALSMGLAACSGSGSSGETASSESGTEVTESSTDDSALSVEEGGSEDTASEEKEQVFAYDYDVENLVTLGEYKGLTYTAVDTSVSDEDVQNQIDQILEAYAEPEQITDRAAENGDTVNIDFVGMFDGEAFDGGTSTGYSLVLGSGSFLDGFEDGLIGVMPGDKVTLELKFPDDYSNNPDYAGKDCTFDVTLNYIEGEEVTPEYNDEFVVSLGITDVKTVDQYRDYIKEQIEETNESEAETSRREELFAQVVENSAVNEIPEELLTQSIETFNEYYNNYATYYGMELADFLDQYVGMTEEEFNNEAENYAKTVSENVLIMCAVAKAEGFEVTDDIYNEKLSEYAEEYGYGDTAMFEEDQGKGNIKQYIINEKVFDILEETAVEVEAKETEAVSESETAEDAQ